MYDIDNPSAVMPLYDPFSGGNLEACESTCLMVDGCLGFSREKAATDDAIADCYFKQELTIGHTDNDPTWQTYVWS
ncbi:unnamed protein product [Didymodactylos carnosus]|uniref:Apple domain-containing protein n=1 Tax=Didymodactylos carnosus TaxID=1234261 RepID=A0A815S5E0_9BILA|nr:unnamed protein product [Didymodactylos carnosus]CAF1487265.1 unnamed protein product [Didymodactylos carnosus]CAF4136225.1 unnamed protein product [Didymodactylos carnosus]CAF4350987.1 unnamed protein product [Didymodactylos carnosus]